MQRLSHKNEASLWYKCAHRNCTDNISFIFTSIIGLHNADYATIQKYMQTEFFGMKTKECRNTH